MTRNEINLAPLRDLDDFLLSSARFQIPNFRDLEKWNNRVTQNMLYYQTNYFLSGLLFVLAVTIFNPVRMIYGCFAFLIWVGLAVFVRYPSSSVTKFRKEHPFIGIVLLLSGLFTSFYLFSHFLVFAVAFLMPIAVMFIHASLRLRNLKNKISNIEREITGKTPMGVVMEMLGVNGLSSGRKVRKLAPTEKGAAESCRGRAVRTGRRFKVPEGGVGATEIRCWGEV